jgi:hypothetical protein
LIEIETYFYDSGVCGKMPSSAGATTAPNDGKNDDPTRPIFNKLAISLFSDGQWIPLTANSREPTPFETDVSSLNTVLEYRYFKWIYVIFFVICYS